MTDSKRTFEYQAQQGQSPLVLLKSTGLTVSTLKQAAQQGAVWLQQKTGKPKRIRRLKQTLDAGDRLWLYFDPDILADPVTDATLINDNDRYSIWCKPRGMFSQPTRWSDANSIARNVERQLGRPTYLVHRLDRMTAGLIILAHRRSLVREFTSAFTAGTVEKKYLAIVAGEFPDEVVEVSEPLDDKPANSKICRLRYDQQRDLSVLEVSIKSGRKHQIRRHLAQLEYPVLGDRLYGPDNQPVDLQLLAWQLGFLCPVKNEFLIFKLTKHQQQTLLVIPA